ncbi:hypothetical protein CERZMDRAFT_110980 [Cercospora zeae-maydis SCOH1-5]|uniref:Amidase domain-containing protein n=1 Tax=Cercospora zeae-maydis SCOH1-5 TaxID=717836 RepID=A0A6A6FKV4_9PEZI|nr:hypothetical protein CERZMDRAFT_110980 [Cercospora zeae-maydis SCOH1-5]
MSAAEPSNLHRPLYKLTGLEAVSLMRSGELKCEDYVNALLARIDQRDEAVKAWVYLNRQQAIEQAQALDRLSPDQRGPLHGLPVGIKDIILTKDMPTQYNSKLFESTTPIATDAAAIAVLRARGALLLGKTTTTEFASSRQGNWHQNLTRNAHAEDRTPGGSSSGSGAAVADFQVPVALGTQTGGSIVRPAAFNGCYGFKPTWGAVSREGIGQWSPTNDTCGFFARSVDDLKLLLDAYCIEDDSPAQPLSLRSSRIAFCKTFLWPNAGPGTQSAMAKAKSLLVAAGARIEDLDLPEEFSHLNEWHDIIIAKEGKASFLGAYLNDESKVEDSIRGHVEDRKNYTRKQQTDAYDNCASLRSLWDSIAGGYDAVVVPSVPDEAPLGLDWTGDMSFNSLWTVLHCPVVHVPGFLGPNGMPVGLSLVSARFTDQMLLETAQLVGQVWQEKGSK